MIGGGELLMQYINLFPCIIVRRPFYGSQLELKHVAVNKIDKI